MALTDMINRIFGRFPNKQKEDDLPKSIPITDSPIVDNSDITFSIRKHKDGKYSCKISRVPSEDGELDRYAKWLAGSFARSIIRFGEICGVEDPEHISEAHAFPLTDKA